jgi:hypothetical protein
VVGDCLGAHRGQDASVRNRIRVARLGAQLLLQSALEVEAAGVFGSGSRSAGRILRGVVLFVDVKLVVPTQLSQTADDMRAVR